LGLKGGVFLDQLMHPQVAHGARTVTEKRKQQPFSSVILQFDWIAKTVLNLKIWGRCTWLDKHDEPS
jgi:hypothetical protein